jgi:hypothetical protein
MTIGVGVEGPSDLQFWDKVLHKHFRGHTFDVRNMKNRDKLIRETPRLMESFAGCHYAAGFSLVDMDDDPCVSAVLGLFDEAVRNTRQNAREARAFHVCIAIKEIESWFLADTTAIQAVMPGCEWEVPEDTRTTAKGRLRTLYKAHLGKQASFNEIAFAKDIAPKFSPARALPHSASFRYFWGILDQRIRE